MLFLLDAPAHVVSSKKPRSRGVFQSLFCCLCHKETEQIPINNNAPLLVEENGTISKVSCLRPYIPLSLLPLLVISPISPSLSLWSFSLMWSTWLRATWSVHMFSLRNVLSCLQVLWSIHFCSSALKVNISLPINQPRRQHESKNI